MLLRRVVQNLLLVCGLVAGATGSAWASAYHGVVTFGGLPVPGSTVTVTATQGDKKVTAISDDQGLFTFADLADGKWTLTIEMTGFAPVKQEIAVAAGAPAGTFELKLLSLAEIHVQARPLVVAVAQSAGSGAAATSAASVSTPAAVAAGKAAAAAKGSNTAGGASVAAAPPPADATTNAANDGFLINGSVNNAATSQFSQNQAFGNNRNGGRSLYNAGLLLRLENSALDAAPYAVDGKATQKQQFNNYTLGLNFGGPINIKRIMPRGPYFGVNYSHTQNNNYNPNLTLIPTPHAAGTDWNLSTVPGTSTPNVTAIYVPSNIAQATANTAPNCYSTLLAENVSAANIAAGTATFPNNTIPAQCVTPQSTALLAYYPQTPNVTTDPRYNFQLPLDDSSLTDSVGVTLQRAFGNKNNVFGRFNFNNYRSTNPTIYGFTDAQTNLGINLGANWNHRFTSRLSGTLNYSFSRSRNQVAPFFANKANVEGNAGIAGGNIDPLYFGPPTLQFSSYAGLSDRISSNNRNETNGVGVSFYWNHLRHNVQFGGDFSRREFNYLTQTNPNGTLSFSGAATRSKTDATSGSDLADFLLGIPDNSAIVDGNPDKYLRQSVYDLFINDDFRVNPEFTMTLGLRWEYGAPITETKGRLVNLDVAPDFSSEQPVLASSPKGPLTGQGYPSSLVHADHSRPEPRIAIAWRPISGSSLLIRSGYDITNDTSVYQSAAYEMATQYPLATSVSIANSPLCGFNIASPFVSPACSTTTPDQFALDPHFRVGYVQSWNLAVQRDLPYSMQMIVTYLGIKGTHGVQEFLPNTSPPPLSGIPVQCAPNACGYAYRTSGGNLERNAGTVELRRRLRNGLTARLLYTFSKSLDDDYSLSGQGGVLNTSAMAQDWQHLRAQRGPSTTDQRHVLNFSAQYTTGMGLGGHSFMSGWRGLAYKEWTVQTTVNYASGLPETPIYFGATASGAGGLPGTIRPNVTGSPYANLKPGYYVNRAAYSIPLGTWGNAGRDSITGPSQFGLDANMNRTFRLPHRMTLDATLNASNVLNHVVYSSYNTTYSANSLSTFGEPQGPKGMRTLSVQFRVRY